MPKEKKQWTVIELLSWTADYLNGKNFENARLETERLLAFVLKCRRIDLYLSFDRPLTPEELTQFRALLKKRLEHTPLQYLFHETEFMSLPFFVSPDVLIPRPETEILAEHAIEICHADCNTESPMVIDIGTGSGAIAISILHYVPVARCVATDISSQALDIAERNANRNGVSDRISFLQHDMRQSWPDDWTKEFHLLVSNPPYISENEYPSLEPQVRDYEPKQALYAKDQGLEYYHFLVRNLKTIQRPRGHALLEIGATMASAVSALCRQYGYQDINIYQDLAGRDRIIHLKSAEA